ncbi:MAG: dihydrofolate reductase family protein [Microbacterium sp.]|nr:dihydrofolate reductase family protein [Microbacterium sp.]
MTPLLLRRTVPPPTETVDVSTEAGRRWLLEQYRPPRREFVRSNTIVSADGSVTGPDGTSSSLGSASDRRVLGVIREHGDIVLVGGATVRAEHFGLPARTQLAVVTESGDLTGHRFDSGGDVPLVVLGPAAARREAERTLSDPEPRAGWRFVEIDSVSAAVPALRALGHASIVAEVGPRALARLLEAALVDEVCITASPVQAGGSRVPPAARLYDGVVVLELVGTDGSRFSARRGRAARAR